jgi:hypothetical protein
LVGGEPSSFNRLGAARHAGSGGGFFGQRGLETPGRHDAGLDPEVFAPGLNDLALDRRELVGAGDLFD